MSLCTGFVADLLVKRLHGVTRNCCWLMPAKQLAEGRSDRVSVPVRHWHWHVCLLGWLMHPVRRCCTLTRTISWPSLLHQCCCRCPSYICREDRLVRITTICSRQCICRHCMSMMTCCKQCNHPTGLQHCGREVIWMLRNSTVQLPHARFSSIKGACCALPGWMWYA